MRTVLDTVDTNGVCRIMVVDVICCRRGALLVRQQGREFEVQLSTIIDWAPITDDDPQLYVSIADWIAQKI